MKSSDFDYHLPLELIAKQPIPQREKSRLLVVEQAIPLSQNSFTSSTLCLHDLLFEDILKFIKPNDLVVFNDSKVIKARLYGYKSSGGKIEILLERILSNKQFTAHIRSNKSIKLGLTITLPNELIVTVIENLDGLFKLETNNPIDLFAYTEQFGSLPLPPYMQRDATLIDTKRYQTVYAANLGSVAAPTAGLHFTPQLLEKILAQKAQLAYITLHVGSGTFKPVKVAEVNQHKMHSEKYYVGQNTINALKTTIAKGGKIIAVGTTSLRALETLAQRGMVAGSGETNIFITPGFKFKLVNKLITNFHLPKSTLLMLVCAFAGNEVIKQAYQHAIKSNYRFFSYGDAMLLNCNSL